MPLNWYIFKAKIRICSKNDIYISIVLMSVITIENLCLDVCQQILLDKNIPPPPPPIPTPDIPCTGS